MIFNRPKTPDGRAPDSIFQKRLADAPMQSQSINVQGAKACRTTRGSYTIQDGSPGSTGISPLKLYAVKDVFDDYLVCREYKGLDDDDAPIYGTTDVYVAKEWKDRCSLTGETVLGVVHTYTYSAVAFETWDAGSSDEYNLVRTDDDGTNSEDQRITPPWTENEIITAIPCKTQLQTVGDSPRSINLIIIGRSAQWAGPIA